MQKNKTYQNYKDILTVSSPKTLGESIELFLTVGPLSEIKDRTHYVLRDFIARKFSPYMLNADDKTRDVLSRLLNDLTSR